MSNYILSYDLNGDNPSHEQMDEHLQKLGVAVGRVLETVWYVGYSGTLAQLRDYVKKILSSDDLLLVVEADEATWTKLLVSSDSLKTAWSGNR
ncbi:MULTISPECIES: hypothetical protein [unclassified Labrenzia]|uniref:hypothetical protein n=1 Tax=unclassified Labrenzia TaxID=2648686 RepID=UPI001267F284|nr:MULTISPECIES: hypothetical protein [unclassified Labrenzia]